MPLRGWELPNLNLAAWALVTESTRSVVWLWGTLQLYASAVALRTPADSLYIHPLRLDSHPTTAAAPPRLPREFELWAPLGPTTARTHFPDTPHTIHHGRLRGSEGPVERH